MANGTVPVALSPERTALLMRALLKGFDQAELKMLLRNQLGLVLAEEVNLNQNLRAVVSELIEAAERGGWVEQLVRGARNENPGNRWLAQAAQDLGFDAPRPALPPATDPRRLEKLVRQRAPSMPFQEFLRKAEALTRALCRIEVPAGTASGTGWLVAPDLVLTNYHVAEPVKTAQVAAADVVCRFDVFTEASGTGTFAGSTPVALASGWEVASSPYSQKDLVGDTGAPADNELDFALLRLAASIGNEPVAVGGKARGWMTVSEKPPAAMAGDIAIVVQHAGGRPLELAFGDVQGYNGNGTRFRYGVNTEPGSSGSPVLTVTLEPFGLHHAGGPGQQFPYNQGIPLRRIVATLVAAGIAPFWAS